MISNFKVIVDFFAIRFLLIIFGVVFAEVLLRLFGFAPWGYVILPGRLHLAMPDKELGWIMTPQHARLSLANAQDFIVTTNSDHTRLVPNSNTQGSSKIALLGDSVIWGWGLDDDKTLAALIATDRQNTRVINAGVPGYGLLQSVLWLERKFPDFKDGIVIIGIGSYLFARGRAALSWTLPAADSSHEYNFSIPYGQISGGKLQIMKAEKIFYELPLRSHLSLVKLIEVSIASISAASRDREALEIEELIFIKLSNLVKDTKTRVFLLQFESDPVIDNFHPLFNNLGFNLIKCIDPREGSESWRIPGDKHPNVDVITNMSKCINIAIDRVV